MELKYMIIWYLVFLCFNVIGLGFSEKYFKKWFDKGYAVSKFLGFLISGLILWIFSSIKLIPFTEWSSIIVFFLLLAFSGYRLVKSKFKFTKTMLKEELVFLFIFVLWNLIKSTNAQIEGTEKFMNIAFMNSINRTEFMPPSDMWFAGSSINYYYIGHYLYTFVAKIGSIPISFAYNFGLNTIISYGFIASFAIIFQLTKASLKKWSAVIALMGATLICFGGNFHYIYKLLEAFVNHENFSYWFPDATRTIPFVINEFPAYSIILGDLHGHFIGFPFLVMMVAFLYNIWHTKFNSKERVEMMLFLSVPLVALYGINSWDFITANFLFLLINFVQFLMFEGELKKKLVTLLILETTLLLPGLIFMAPYFYNFKPAVGGIGFVPLNTERDLKEWLLMWGAQLSIIFTVGISYLVLMKSKASNIKNHIKSLIKENDVSIFAFLLGFAAFALIIGVEILYVKDLFDQANPPYFRTNTVFKFYFAAWPIFFISCFYFINAISRKIYTTPLKNGFLLLAINGLVILIVFVSSFSYIFEALNDFYSFFKFEDGKNFSFDQLLNGDKTLKLYDTIDGNAYIKKLYPEDYAMINWINTNVTGQAVIAEAVGDAYTYYCRISANTGLTDIIGWPTHEWQWRSNIDEINARKEELKDIYTTESKDDFLKIVKKYFVKYIVVGDKERETYTDLSTDIIKQYCTESFRSNDSVIYECKL